MWQFILRQLLTQAEKQPLKRAGSAAAGMLFNREANAPEAYVDRVKRDFHLQEHHDALELYASDPAYWKSYYASLPRPDWATEIQHDSVRAAGVPSRYNVVEYGYPETSVQPVSANAGTLPGEGSPDPNKVLNDRFGTWGSFPAPVTPPSAPAAPASLSDRFGRWGSAPADSFDKSSSPVLRYLEKYRRSALPEARNPSAQTASLPTAPSGPIAPTGGNAGFDEISGLPSAMRNELAY